MHPINEKFREHAVVAQHAPALCILNNKNFTFAYYFHYLSAHTPGAIIFGSDQEVRQVMRAVRRSNATGAFSWIGSDGWSARNLVSDDYEPEASSSATTNRHVYVFQLKL